MTIDENCENFDTSYKIWEMYKRIYKWSKYWDFENQKIIQIKVGNSLNLIKRDMSTIK